jgi:hypothetical protein
MKDRISPVRYEVQRTTNRRCVNMAEYQLKPGKVGQKVIDGYKKVEEKVTGAYQRIEDGVVGAYRKVENAFVDRFLEKVEENDNEEK